MKQGIKTGIQQIAVLEGLVPEFEEREAAIYNGYTWKEWLEFDLLDPFGRWHRASGIAAYRMHFLQEAHINDAQNEDMERRSHQK